VEVVTPAAFCEAHRQELPPRDDCRVLAAERGDDTARTLLIAWRRFKQEKSACSHIWAHPVDLPLVTGETLDLLAGCSRRDPDRIVRPVREGIPGHPVILPYDILAALDLRPSFHGGPLRDFISRGVCGGWLADPLGLAVDDEGIDRDFDQPDDLRALDDLPGKGECHE
jgi:CTP:molybdopterin cytidylyltransferase MocA